VRNINGNLYITVSKTIGQVIYCEIKADLRMEFKHKLEKFCVDSSQVIDTLKAQAFYEEP
jgi:hypothetical protein